MSAPDPGKIQKFREMLHQEWTGVRRPSAAFNVSMEERLLFTDRGYSGIAAPAQGPFSRAAVSQNQQAAHDRQILAEVRFLHGGHHFARCPVVVEQNRHRSRVPEHDKRLDARLVSCYET